jgi:hypothetical protein
MNRYLISKVQYLAALYALLMPIFAFAATNNATMTVGKVIITESCISIPFQEYGYSSGDFGSYSPTGLTGGETVVDLFDLYCGSIRESQLEVDGFSVDPGQLWLASVKCNGITLSASAASFSYASGLAVWTWSSQFGLSALVGENVSCSIVHN